jgi:DNA-binding CsgD family transcriptional regulator
MTSVSAGARQRASDKIARLAGQGRDLVGFWRASTEVLAGAVPHYQAPCWYTLDPASLLITSHFNQDMPEIPGEWLAPECYQDDVNNLAEVARSQRGISTLHEATGGDPDAGRLPSSVLAVAGRALRTAEHPGQPGEVAVSRVLSRSGTWVVLHGAALVSGAARRVAVIVEPAHPARIAPLLMSAYGLTEREQDVTRLVLQGNSTAEIAQRLVVSAHTVQQHLKNIFGKTGVRSRRDLVGKVFFAHYEPRVRDNERRATEHRPLRGGPLSGGATT